MWTTPTDADSNSSWITEKVLYNFTKENDYFVIQKNQENGTKTMFKNLWQQVQNVFELKQPPFRIIYRLKDAKVVSCKLVAVGETEKEILEHWTWIESFYYVNS